MKVRLTLTVDYEKDDGSLPEEGECHGLLEELARLAANRGLLTGEAPGLLAGSWDYDVKTVNDRSKVPGEGVAAGETRSSVIACLMAGIETPGDLTDDEKQQHQEDLLAFLQDELGISEAGEEQPCNLCGRKFADEVLTAVSTESSGTEYFCPECAKIKDDDQEELVVPPVREICRCSGGFNLNAAVGGNVTCLTCGKPYGGRPEPELGQGKAYTGSLNDQRQDECEHIYQNGHPDFDWFDQPPVEDANGWETAQPGDEYWRTVFVRDAENPDGPTIAMSLHITFQPRTVDVKQITFGRK